MTLKQLATWTVASLLVLGQLRSAAAEIAVQVNGKPVSFTSARPAQISGRVFIPLRAVVESLGAEVKWDAATQTVRGSKGSQEFSLRIGDRAATVNGKEVTLDVPAQLIGGATMVPLRFVAEALGAEVEWNAAQQTVMVNAADSGAGGGAADRVTGEVVAVRATDQESTLTIRTGGVRHTYQVEPDSVILRGEQGKRGQQVDLSDIQVGDQVRLRVDAQRGRTNLIEATVPKVAAVDEDAVTGVVTALRGDGGIQRVTVRTARGPVTFEVPDDAGLTRVSGSRTSRLNWEDLEVGDHVRVTPDRTGRMARSVQVTRPDGNPAPAPGERLTGTIVAVKSDAVPPTIVVRSGNNRAAYEIAQDSVLFRSVGTGRAVRVSLDELSPGDEVRLRLDRSGSVAELVEAKGPAAVVDPQVAQGGDLKINSFAHDAVDTLRSGSQVRVTLTGTPGGTATFDVGNIARGVAMQEIPGRPGRYAGSYTIPKGVTAREVTVTAQLKAGNRVAPLVQAGTELSIDSEPPSLTGMAPADKSETTNQAPDIYVEISDGAGSGIDSTSLKLMVGGKDVTDQAKLTPRFIIYSPKTSFTPGLVPVTVSLRDKAGNETTSAWAFTVKAAPQALQSVTHDADRALRTGDILTVTVRGTPRGRGTFSLGDQIRNVPLQEAQPGVYRGTYVVRQGDLVDRQPVVVEFVAPDGTRTRQETSAPVNITTRGIVAPEITYPARKFRLGEEVTVEGTAAPGARVVVEVSYSGRAFDVVSTKGSLGSQEVVADKNGRWISEPFRVKLPLGVSKPEITIQATATDTAGRVSKPVVVTLPTR